MSATNPPTKKYRGNCHCGAFVFELDVPEIKSVSDCDCSICHKKGYLWLRPENPPTVVKDEGTIVSYEFGLKKYTHEVCCCPSGFLFFFKKKEKYINPQQPPAWRYPLWQLAS